MRWVDGQVKMVRADVVGGRVRVGNVWHVHLVGMWWSVSGESGEGEWVTSMVCSLISFGLQQKTKLVIYMPHRVITVC